MRKFRIIRKTLKFAIILLALFFVYFFLGPVPKPDPMEWGVTFSKAQAEGLGLPWKEVYIAILDDLKVNNLRLSAYWNEVEPQKGVYNFDDLDYQVSEASKRNAQILLGVGRRLPRWPECHEPGWTNGLEQGVMERELLNYISTVVRRYKDNPNITMWQVENEFFLRNFGDCPPANPPLLDQELQLVRSLDSRPIVITDSGELGGWWGASSRADVFGTTMYRTIYNKNFGFATYPLQAVYYLRRFWLYRPFVRAKRIINVELQAEPWSIKNDLPRDSVSDWNNSLSPVAFRKNIEYARNSGISPAYLWGVEWWYYANKVKSVNVYWDTAKELWVK